MRPPTARKGSNPSLKPELELLRAVTTARHTLPLHFATRKVEELIRNPNGDRAKPPTDRQREVLQLLAEGHSMKQVAAILTSKLMVVLYNVSINVTV